MQSGPRMDLLKPPVLSCIALVCLACGGDRPELPCADGGEGSWQDSSFERSVTTTGWQPPMLLLDDGRVAQIGRREGRGAMEATAWDPATGDTLPLTPPSTDAFRSWLVKLDDGSVLMGGGEREWSPNTVRHAATQVERYDPAADSWQPAADLPDSYDDVLRAVPLPGSRALLISGSSEPPLLFDAAGDTWTPRTPSPVEFRGEEITPLSDGTVLLEGFTDRDPGPVAQTSSAAPTWDVAFHYDPVADSWQRLEPSAVAAMRVIDAAGGLSLVDPNQPIPDGAERLADRPAPQFSGYFASTRMPDGRWLFASGIPGSADDEWTDEDYRTARRLAEIYDPSARRWSCAAPLPPPAGDLPPSASSVIAMITLRDGRPLHIDHHGASRTYQAE